MKTIKIEYLGKGQKIVELPVPFVSKCERTGQVICDPIGEFPEEDGLRLLEIAGPDGLFRQVGEVIAAVPPQPEEPKFYDKLCKCGCGQHIEVKKSHKFTGIPNYLLGHAGKRIPKKEAESEIAPSPV